MRCRSAVLAIPVLVLAASGPFWDTKAPAAWTPEEIHELLTDSPWAQVLEGPRNSGAPPVQVYIASASPLREAEIRARAFGPKKLPEDVLWDEYQAYADENAGKYIILAARIERPEAFSENAETRHLEEDTVLKIGKRKYRIEGHLAPSKTDPFVRIVFPKEIEPSDKTLKFELYLPGVTPPFRQAEFELKGMTFHGKLDL